jgi:uncharacterized protein (TIGR03790 family)
MALPERFRYANGPDCLKTIWLVLLLTGPFAFAQNAGPQNVLLVVNDKSAVSRTIAEYYARKRSIPQSNICHISTSVEEDISRTSYDQTVAAPIRLCLQQKNLVETVLYLVTTLEVPLRIEGTTNALNASVSSVDSELTLLYTDIKSNQPHPLPGGIRNPFYGHKDARFSHAQFPIYLVTRLAAYDFADVRNMIDRSLQAKNQGKFVIDMSSFLDTDGNNWLRDAALHLPAERVIVDQSSAVLYEQSDVIGYAGWGSNDKNRHRRFLGFHWLPGAIMTEFVSTNARTFQRPPDDWNIGDWGQKALWWKGAPQTLSADYILEGATGASGHVAEPYLIYTPHPDFLLPAYFSGRNLAESYYLSIPMLSWQNIVIGDPLCSLGKP